MQNNSMLQSGEGCPDLKQGLVCSAIPTERAQVSSVQDLFSFICSGPLIDKMGFSKEKIGNSIDKWIAYNSYLCRLFQLNELYLTFPQKVRFFHYYIPVFLWCEDQISQHVSKFKDGEDIPPFVVCVRTCYFLFYFSNCFVPNFCSIQRLKEAHLISDHLGMW